MSALSAQPSAARIRRSELFQHSAHFLELALREELRALLVLAPTLLLQSLIEETLLLFFLSHGLRGRDRRQKFVSFDLPFADQTTKRTVI